MNGEPAREQSSLPISRAAYVYELGLDDRSSWNLIGCKVLDQYNRSISTFVKCLEKRQYLVFREGLS
jgi:hypothetical protein